MAPRPRKRRYTTTPNFYVKRDSRTGKLSCQYKDLRTGKFHSLPSNLEEAEQMARELNVLIGHELLEAEKKAILEMNNSLNITVGNWVKEYMEIQQEKLKRGEMKPSTLEQRKWSLNPVLAKYKNLRLCDLNTVTLSKFLKGYIEQGKATMAQRIRSCMIDVFAEAIAAGHFPADKPNPAAVTKMPRIRIKRARLTLEVFKQVIEWSKQHQKPYLWRAYLLAILTGQRLDDIGKASFKDIKRVEGIRYLEVIQTKTGTKLLIPLELRLESIDCSIQDVISMCRDRVVSPHLFHHVRRTGKTDPGDKVRTKSLSIGFAKAIRALKIDWGDYDPPSFHEIRSLSEREYKKQGINTKNLLGHKHQTTTDTYADPRGHDWIVVKMGE